jgi:hypothetical protein
MESFRADQERQREQARQEASERAEKLRAVAIQKAVEVEFKAAHFTGSIEHAMRMLDRSAIDVDLETDTVIGVDTQLEELKAQFPGMFVDPAANQSAKKPAPKIDPAPKKAAEKPKRTADRIAEQLLGTSK